MRPGNWVWNVRIAPTAAGTPMARRTGVRLTTGVSSIISVANAGAGNLGYQQSRRCPASYAWVDPRRHPCQAGRSARQLLRVPTDGTTVVTLPPSAVIRHRPSMPALDQIFAALGSKDLVAGDLTTPAGTTIAASTPFLKS